MSNSKIEPIHLKYIVDQIYEHRCVPFLGAAANVNCKERGYKGLPLGFDIANELVNSIDFIVRDPKDLARIALQYEFKTTRLYLIKFLKTILPDQKCKPSPLLKTIAKLPFQLIITTNYDRLMEQALKNEGKNDGYDFEIVVQPTEGFENHPKTKQWLDELFQNTDQVLYKIHGSFYGSAPPKPGQSDSKDESIVTITEEDYINFLSLINREDEKIGIPRSISSKITYSTLLFLGYSLEDWDFRTIYKVLIEPLPWYLERRSFAIQKDPSDFWIKFWHKKGVEIYNMDLYEFADLLYAKYQEEYGKISNKAKEI